MNLERPQRPRESKRLWFAATGWLLGANLIRNLGLFVILVLLARFTDPTAVGNYSLALAITAPIFIFAQLGLKGVYLTHRSEYKFSRYLSVQVAAVAVAVAVAVVLTAITNLMLVMIVLLVSFVRISDAVSDLYGGPLQAAQSTAWIFWSALASSSVGAIAAAWCLFTTHDLSLTLLCLAVVTIVASGVALWLPAQRLVRKSEAARDFVEAPIRPIRAIATAGIPSGAGNALIALVASVPQYILAATWGAEAVGQYAVLFYVIMVADIFVGTLTQGWITRAREASESGAFASQGFFKFTLNTAILWSTIMLPAAVLGIALASYALPLVFGAEYTISLAVAIPIAVMVIIAPVLNFTSVAIIVRNLYMHTLSLSVISAVASIVLGFLLIPRFGLTGAFWTFTLAAAARAVPGLLLIRRSERPAGVSAGR